MIAEHFSHNSVPEIMQALRQERRPEFVSWAEEACNTLATRSPLALSATFELLKRGKEMTLAQCLDMEFRLDQEWLRHGDLIEGIRALIVDKDKQPKWEHADIGDVTAGGILNLFDKKPDQVALAL